MADLFLGRPRSRRYPKFNIRRDIPLKQIRFTEECLRDVIKSRTSLQIRETVAADATLILAAPNADPFAGEQVWDVMYSLGLRWGDMDIFHWENHTEEGDDYFFSVWTTTEPGYFPMPR